MNDELMHYGVKGMKWGVRKKYKRGESMDANDQSDSKTTRRVKNDYNTMSDTEFRKKYSASKETYRKRVNRYGDPYMKSPLAKAGKKLEAKQKAKSNESAMKRGAKAIGTVLQVAGSIYAIDMAYTGGAVTRAATKAGKAAVKSALSKVGDQMFDYSILDKDGKVLRRYN